MRQFCTIRGADAISRSILAFATRLIVMGLDIGPNDMKTPWAQDSGLMPRDNDIIWPVLVAVVIPLIITWAVWKMEKKIWLYL